MTDALNELDSYLQAAPSRYVEPTEPAVVHVARVYLQASSAPDAPEGGSFNFETLVLTPPDGWSESQPTSTTMPTYVAQYTFATPTPGSTVAAGVWTAPVVTAQNGAQGPGGADGGSGYNPSMTVNGTLSKTDLVLPSKSNGVVLDYSSVYTEMSVALGGADDTSKWALSAWSNNGITWSLDQSAKRVSVTNVPADGGTVWIQAARSAYTQGMGNLLRNASFLLDSNSNGIPDGWEVYNNGYLVNGVVVTDPVTAQVVSSGGVDGGAFYQLTWTSPNQSSKGIWTSNALYVNGYPAGVIGSWKTGVWYTISFYAKGDAQLAASNASSSMFLGWDNGPQQQVALNSPSLTTTWQRYAFKVKWDVGAPVPPGALWISCGAGTGVLGLDNVQVEEGESASPWMPMLEYFTRTFTLTKAKAPFMSSARGTAINEDPVIENAPSWLLVGNVTLQSGTTAPGAACSGYLSSPNAATTDNIAEDAKAYAIDPNRTYKLTAALYTAAPNDRNMYIYVDFFDAAGTKINGTGWGGYRSGYVYGGAPANGAFTRQGGTFGAGTPRAIPAAARTARIGVWFQYSGSGTSSVQQAAQDVRLEFAEAPFTVDVGADFYSAGSYGARTVLTRTATVSPGNEPVSFRWSVENEVIVQGAGTVKDIWIDGSTTSATVTVKANMGLSGQFGVVTADIVCYATGADGRPATDAFHVEVEY